MELTAICLGHARVGEILPWACEKTVRELRRYDASSRHWAEEKGGRKGVCHGQRKNRSAVSRIEADHIFEKIILASPVGVANSAGLIVGGRAITTEIQLTPPVWNAVANAVKQGNLKG